MESSEKEWVCDLSRFVVSGGVFFSEMIVFEGGFAGLSSKICKLRNGRSEKGICWRSFGSFNMWKLESGSWN